MPKDKVTEEYGSLVFSDAVMQERLPKPTYKELSKVIHEGKTLDLDIANEVAHAMKEWALEKGATHFTHWFQPLTGITSEKHDSFVTPKKDGTSIMTFSGKELIQGEPDASSFPSGGLRATFEARGYTAWDPTSPAFIKDEVLCIPTAFISYTGEALDKKTPLLRSMVTLDTQAKRVLDLFDKKPVHVTTTIGPEQEYFLIKEEDYAARPDLILCGRTLFGCAPAKGQELEEHYFGAIRPTVNEFMKELDDDLWKLGVPAKTKHNEVAPCQHELAPIYEEGSVAIDNNLITMEKMKLDASHHGLVCLQHEKPFEYVNGSGKHDNWSLIADGKNLLDPSDTPEENLQFLIFLTSVIAAVDDHADLLRASVASAGNDHRLGANEAPPAIVSIFLGDDLNGVVESIINGTNFSSEGRSKMDLGVPQLADITRDTTDRNRTSPFAFTGNKFEFRMPGSSFNIACTNVMLNTAVADSLMTFAEELEKAEDFDEALATLIKRELAAHQRILFNGNGYSAEWPIEAEKRGLLNLRSTPEALVHYTDAKNVALFARHGVYTELEMKSREEIGLEEYGKVIHIEALTSLSMLKKQIIPAAIDWSKEMADGIAVKKSIGVEAPAETAKVQELTDMTAELMDLTAKLEAAVAGEPEELTARAMYAHETVIPAMEAARKVADALEMKVAKKAWPMPTYADMLFYV